MHTEDEEREILYPNINYCRFLKNWVKYTVAQGKDALEGFYTRQKQIGEVLNPHNSNSKLLQSDSIPGRNRLEKF